MHAIAPLLAGIRGAEGGTVRIYARGTTTAATWYETFEGDTAHSSGAPVALDDNGGREMYVSELVDVVVYDSDGAEVRRFTDGYASGSIEVRSQSFTGVNYDDASQGAGSNYPLSLQRVLDRWKDKTGAIDWDVLLGGQTQTLIEVLGALAGPAIFNVKSDEYGAVGDGVVDDTAAIAAAIDAADASGGVVYFPPGTYRISSALSPDSATSLVGAGMGASAILTDHATAVGINLSAGTSLGQTIRGLRIGCSQSCTGARISVSNSAKVRIEQCFLGGTNLNGNALLVADAATEVTAVDCVMSTPAATANLVQGDGKRIKLERCKFIASAGTYNPSNGLVYASTCDIVGCVFDASACTSGTIVYYRASSTTLNATLRGNRFLATGGATVTAMTLGSYTATSYFEESESFFGASVTAYSYLAIHAGNSKGAIVRLHSRTNRRYEVTDNSVSIASLPWDQYGIIKLVRSTGADQAVNMFAAGFATVPPDGARCNLVYLNLSGGAIANLVLYRFGGLAAIVTHTTIADQTHAVLEFLSFVYDGTTPEVAAISVTDEQN